MEILNDCFMKSTAIDSTKKYPLNYSESKTLQVVLKSVYPIVKVFLELRAVNHKESVFFSIKTWQTLIKHGNGIRRAMINNNERTFFANDELKVFTERMHDQCAVSFLDIAGKRVNIMLKTFEKMKSLDHSIMSDYNNNMRMMQKTAKNLKDFTTFILVQCTNNKNCKELKEHLEMLSHYAEPNTSNSGSDSTTNSSDTEIEEFEDEYEDEYDCYDDYEDYRCSNCGKRHCRNGWF